MRRHDGITRPGGYASTHQKVTVTGGRTKNWGRGERVWWVIWEEEVGGGKREGGEGEKEQKEEEDEDEGQQQR
jgi:hypothetical protein